MYECRRSRSRPSWPPDQPAYDLLALLDRTGSECTGLRCYGGPSLILARRILLLRSIFCLRRFVTHRRPPSHLGNHNSSPFLGTSPARVWHRRRSAKRTGAVVVRCVFGDAVKTTNVSPHAMMLVAALALAMAGCPGGQADDSKGRRDGGPGGSSAADAGARANPIDVDRFCAEAIPAYCSHLARCRPQDALESYDDCLVDQGPRWCAELLTVQRLASVKAGRMYWHAARAAQCIDDMNARACRTSKVRQCVPSKLLLGQVETGDACLFPASGGASECRRGYCRFSEPCTAACSSLLAQGATCTSLIDCAGGLYCIDNATNGDCGASAGSGACTCQPRLRLDDPCSVEAGAPACEVGLFCMAGHCARQPLAAGSPCKWAVDCEGDLACLADPSGATCAPRREAGGECRSIDDCAAGLTCLANGRCGPFVTTEQIGGDCADPSDVDGGGDCGLGYTCALVGCMARQTSLGGSCPWSENDCYGKGLYCVRTGPNSATCQVAAQLGESCYTRPCADPSLQCRSGTCSKRGALGDACVDAEDCASGNCFVTQCAQACQP